MEEQPPRTARMHISPPATPWEHMAPVKPITPEDRQLIADLADVTLDLEKKLMEAYCLRDVTFTTEFLRRWPGPLPPGDYTFSRDTVWFFGKAYRWVTDNTTGQILLRLDESYPILFTRGARRAYAAYQRQQIFTPDGMS